jgi:hypothetical protein
MQWSKKVTLNLPKVFLMYLSLAFTAITLIKVFLFHEAVTRTSLFDHLIESALAAIFFMFLFSAGAIHESSDTDPQ